MPPIESRHVRDAESLSGGDHGLDSADWKVGVGPHSSAIRGRSGRVRSISSMGRRRVRPTSAVDSLRRDQDSLRLSTGTLPATSRLCHRVTASDSKKVFPMYDSIVVGAGINGLTCAAYLAKAGRKVLVLEANPRVGGFVVTEDAPGAPGYKVNPYAIEFPFADMNPSVASELDLARFGLRFVPLDPNTAPSSAYPCSP